MNIIEAQKALYKQVFNDSEYFTDMLFSQLVTEESSFYIPYKDEIISSLQLFDYKANMDNRRYKCGYIYAVMTDPRYRHLGLMTQLMNRAIDEARRRGHRFLFLTTDSPDLCFMYESFGFRSLVLNRNYTQIARSSLIHEYHHHRAYIGFSLGTSFSLALDDDVRDSDFEEFYEVYKRGVKDSILLTQRQLRFLYDTTIAEGGRLLCCGTYDPGYCLYSFKNDKPYALVQCGNESLCFHMHSHAAAMIWSKTHKSDDKMPEKEFYSYKINDFMVLILDNKLNLDDVFRLKHSMLMDY